ncbi:hypothetical protein [Nocardia thailandica]|uniref:hypothetical protein n=1 Tax=Nocardia thailandica TaxID=257275 RepID=UPI0002D42732|nr:hypothetical protein [Nocardia thailandica]
MNTSVKVTFSIGHDTYNCGIDDALTLLNGARRDTAYPMFANTELDVHVGTDNPYWQLIRLMARNEPAWPGDDEWQVGWFSPRRPYPTANRSEMCKTFAWSIPSPADLLWIKAHLGGRDMVEIGAGAGYWAWQLRQLGVDVAAYDNKSWEVEQQWADVQIGDEAAAGLHPDRALLLVWPPYDDPMAAAALSHYSGDTVIFAGEADGGCTADDAFYQALATGWVEIGQAPYHPTYWGIHCRLTAYRRQEA